MLIKELKEIIKKYDDNEKQKIIIELYKRIPKAVKEDYEIDNYIMNIKDEENIKKQNEEINIDELEKEINYFLQCANNGLYARPNKIISKKERQGWRFKVKKYYKSLNKFPADTIDGDKATDMLKKIYILLSTGTTYLRFSSWNTFSAIGVNQAEFLENIMLRKLLKGINKEAMKYCVDLLLVEYDPYQYHKELFSAFQYCLKTVDAKNIALEQLKFRNTDLNSKYLEIKKSNNSHLIYDYEESINSITELIASIYFDLCEINEGIEYFQKNYIENDKEIKEYVLFNLLEEFNLYNYWIKEYDKYAKTIEYRDSIKGKYQEIKRKANINNNI